jgi:hypothetical protein
MMRCDVLERQGQLPKINAIVDEVDKFDPWVFQEFNIRGPGEGTGTLREAPCACTANAGGVFSL